MKEYDERIDGYRPSWAAKFGYIIIGFALGIPGILIDWAIGHRKRMMECSAEAIWLGIIGWALSLVCWFVLNACGVGFALVTNPWITVGLGALSVPVSLAAGLAPAHFNGWGIFLLVVACLFIILSMLWVYGLRYKMTPEEKKLVLHGDDWIKPGEKHLRYDSAITIDAPPEKIWPYIRQTGQDRAGWYSFDWLERLCTFDIHNHYDIHPEWQEFEPGRYQWFHQAPLSIGEWVTETSNDGPWYFAAHSDTATDPTYKHPGPNQEKALGLWFKRFCWTWNWQLLPVEGQPGRTRLMWRCDCTFDPYSRTPWSKYFVVFILGTASIVMGRDFMDVMKKLCEGRLKYGPNKA